MPQMPSQVLYNIVTSVVIILISGYVLSWLMIYTELVFHSWCQTVQTIGYTNYYKPHATYMAQGKKMHSYLFS